MAEVLKFSEAYRLLKRPALSTGNSFEFSASGFSPEINTAIQALIVSKTGRFDELLIDGADIDPSKFTPSSVWSVIELIFVLDTSGNVPVFKNFEQLMARSKSFVREQLPDCFYLLEEDVLSSDEPLDQRIKTLQALCQLIVYLADLAHFHDEKELSDEYKLVFVAEDTAKGERAITLYPYLDLELLGFDVDTELVDGLQVSKLDESPHLSKERLIFRATLIEYLSGHLGGKERFKFLISTWAQFLSLYGNNLSTYLSGFSFHKAKQEVASAQLTIADQMSKVVSDISGKILGVPISLAAVIVISKAENVLESSILVTGISITSALLAETLAAQKLQYERIKHSRLIMFSSHQQKVHQYPEDLRGYIEESVAALVANERKLKRSLMALRSLAWFPAIVATCLHAYIYHKNFSEGVKVFTSFVLRLFHLVLS
ncbi:hypothetical protein [Pseudomonas fluorescens]|uniref:Uncharacterized protein n=1 Tax=Pseudomonas fluorescens TaxID=294 RepID=A0A0D0PJ03_PSEFL|nr:hypothetical protein [Pseudomonas fluorescens]KIQ58668.1 hypothetical protein RL74_14570 [Pseudomonas fluorescens]